MSDSRICGLLVGSIVASIGLRVTFGFGYGCLAFGCFVVVMTFKVTAW